MADGSKTGVETTSDLVEQAVHLARRWVSEAADEEVDPAAQRLAGVLKDPNGLPFTIGFVDGVMRPESLTAAAANLHRVAGLAPGFLPWYLRGAVRPDARGRTARANLDAVQALLIDQNEGDGSAPSKN